MDVLDVFELYSDASESKLKNFEKKLSSNMEVKIETEKPKTELRWVTMMEDTMVYINNILNAPTRLIINEEAKTIPFEEIDEKNLVLFALSLGLLFVSGFLFAKWSVLRKPVLNTVSQSIDNEELQNENLSDGE